MPELWFGLVALMLTAYVVLDGFDLGVGMLHLFVARTDAERRQVIASIGPVWDGNEVWLLAGGATMFFAFPGLYAAGFSGFYLPLMVVLWLVMFRGMSIELRSHVDHPLWAPFWDAIFFGGSSLLVVFFGAALGNILRGVPMAADGDFFLPFWTTFSPYGDAGVLDWFTILVTILVVATLVLHGALWLRYKTAGPVAERAGMLAKRALLAVAVLTAAVTSVAFSVQPQLARSFTERPFFAVFPAIAVAGLLSIFVFSRGATGELKSFLGSCAFIIGMLSSVVSGLFPYVLPSNIDPSKGLTIYNTATYGPTMSIGIFWWLPGILLAIGYATFVYRRSAGKVELDETGGGHYGH